MLLLLWIFARSVLLGELVFLDGDIHRLEVGLHATLLVLGALLDDPVIRADDEIHIADLGKVERTDGLFIERRLLTTGDHDDLWREVLEAHRNLEVVARLVPLLTGRHHADIPAVINEALNIVGVFEDDAEIAVTGAVVLVLLAGEVPENNAGIFDDNVVEQVEKTGFITVHDDCCGGGATLIAAANVARDDLEKAGLNFQNHILFSAQDIEETVALMCYIQLSLLGVAGFVKVGNSLTDSIRNGDSLENYWFTPMYFSDVWHTRRVINQMMNILREERESDDH